jgi:enoyl-CoA hydratase
MQYEYILYEEKEDIASVTVNRPKALNALNAATIEELSDVFSKIKKNEQVRLVIVTGSGTKAFVAGGDINELGREDSVGGKLRSVKAQKMRDRIEWLGKPVIAAVNGFAFGGGCELALACHIRIASHNAKFGQPEVNLGLMAFGGGTQRLPRLIGRGRALELLLTGDIIDAAEAYRIGLVNKVVSPESLLPEAEKLARTILSKGPVAVKLTLESVLAGADMDMREAIAADANRMALIWATDDVREGTRAFKEKRKPRFQGK